MVNRKCESSVVAMAAFAVNVLVLIFALISLFASYSLVKWLYFEIAFLFFVVADIYDELCRSFSAAVVNIISTLIALSVVFYSPKPCDLLVIYVNA